MAADKLTYENKQYGSLWRHTEANAVKEVVNSHADDIDALGQSVSTMQGSIQQNVSQMSGLSNQLGEQATAINGIASRVSAIEADHSTAYHDSSPAIISPSILHVWTEPLESLTVYLNEDYEDASLEYKLRFTVATNLSSPFTLSMRGLGNINLEVAPVWVGGEEPEWEEGYTYEISMMGLLAVAAGWAPAES